MTNATVGEVLAHAAQRLEAAGVEDGALEAEVLLASTLRIDRTRLLALLRDTLSGESGRQFDDLVTRRLRHEPLAYVVGYREFYGIKLTCKPGILIPRPETEMLVDQALGEVRASSHGLSIGDIGTGGGAVAIAISVHAPSAQILATDCSQEALDIAQENARLAGVADRIEFVRSDLLAGDRRFDVIVANLPYVSEDEWDGLPPEIREHEPRQALVGGSDGTEVIRRLLAATPDHLADHGVLALEIGAAHGRALMSAARKYFPEASIRVRTDLAGLDRVLEVRR